MAHPDTWVWGELTPALREHASACARAELDRIKAERLGPGRHLHTADQVWQRTIGAEGHLGFCVLTGRPIPTVEEYVATWGGPDVENCQVKTISQRHYRLLFTKRDADLSAFFALVYNDGEGRIAICGWRDAPTAYNLSTLFNDPDMDGREPTWVLGQEEVLPWPPPADLWPPAPVAPSPPPARPLCAGLAYVPGRLQAHAQRCGALAEPESEYCTVHRQLLAARPEMHPSQPTTHNPRSDP